MRNVKLTKLEDPLSKLTNVATENSATILTALGCFGVLSTIGLTIKATVKATKTVEEHREDIDKIPRKAYKTLEAVRLTWKNYIPAALAGGATIGCIIGANNINLKRNAALLAASIAAEDKLIGGDSRLISSKEDEESTDKSNGSFVVNAAGCKCLDSFSGRIFDTTPSQIQEARTAIYKLLADEGSVTVNNLYHELGLDEIPVGDSYGWSAYDNDTMDISINTTLDDHYGPIMVLDYEAKCRW